MIIFNNQKISFSNKSKEYENTEFIMNFLTLSLFLFSKSKMSFLYQCEFYCFLWILTQINHLGALIKIIIYLFGIEEIKIWLFCE